MRMGWRSIAALSILAVFVAACAEPQSAAPERTASLPAATTPPATQVPAGSIEPTVLPAPPKNPFGAEGMSLVERAARVVGPPLDASIPAQDRPEAQCLAEAVLAEGIEDQIPEMPDLTSLFGPMPPVADRVAELGADCILATDFVGAMIADRELTPSPERISCIQAVLDLPETRNFLIGSIRNGEPSGERPDFDDCL